MSIEATARKAGNRLQKEITSIADRVGYLVPKLGPGIGPRRDLIRLLVKAQKLANRRFDALISKVAGREPKLRAMIRRK